MKAVGALVCLGVLMASTQAMGYTSVGSACSNTNPNACGSGTCQMGVCVASPLNGRCVSPSDCLSFMCNNPPGQILGVCIPAKVGTQCTAGKYCSSGNCDMASHLCAPNSVDSPVTVMSGQQCYVNSDCYSGSCDTSQNPPVCTPVGAGGTCNDNSDCVTMVCGPGGICQKSTVYSPPASGVGTCRVNSDCTTNDCDLSIGVDMGYCAYSEAFQPCMVNSDCTTDSCASGACLPSPANGPCAANIDCYNLACRLDEATPTCGGKIGESCATAATCLTQNCVATICQQASFTTGNCYRNSDCTTNSCSVNNPAGVYASLGTCNKAAAGGSCSGNTDCTSASCSTAVPGGTCLANNVDSTPNTCGSNQDCVNLHCVSGMCTPAIPFAPCGDAADCTTLLCDATLHVCDTIATGMGTCAQNADCTSNYCVAPTCTGCTTNAECGSGVCSSPGATTGICERNMVGKVCVLFSDCTSGVCTSGVCAVAAVGGMCETDSDCSSGLCNDNEGGVCEAVSRGGQCFDNTDCATGICSVCDSSDTCTGQRGQCLAAGAGGACAIDRDCTTHICSATTHTCTTSTLFGSCENDGDCAAQLWCSPPVERGECHELNGGFPHRFCDFNICTLPFNGYCDPNALCTPRPCGSRHCSCNDGYLGNGDLVTTVRPAEGEGDGRRDNDHHDEREHHERDNDPGCFSPCTATSCDNNAVCTPHGHEGDIFCECNAGYVGTGAGGSGTPGNCLLDPCTETVIGGVLATACGPVEMAYCFADLTVPPMGSVVAFTCSCMNPFHQDQTQAPGTVPPNCVLKPALPLTAGLPPSCLPANVATFGGLAHCACGSQHVIATLCVANNVGGVCDIADDCTTQICACPHNEITCAPQHMRCLKSTAGGPCAADGDCTTGRCDTAFSMKCEPNGLGGRCRSDTDCSAGLFCFDPLEEGEAHDGRRRDHDDDEHDDDRRCAPNKCVDNNGGCDPNAWCMPVGPELRMCTCKTSLGYFGAGYEFDPTIPGSGCTNPCLVENGGCYQDAMSASNNAICTPTGFNSVQCQCQPAFVGTGVTDYGCVMDLCGSVSLPHMQPDSTPSMPHLFYGCPSGSHCITVTVPQIQGPYLTCQPDTQGLVYVEKAGSTGQLVADPCNVNVPAGQRALRPSNGGCGEHATCSTDVSGNVQCSCQSGYSPQGLTFRPNQHVNCLRDPCATLGSNGLPDNGGCDPNALCFPIEEFDRRFGENERRHHGFREGDFRVCVCVPPQVGDGIFCVDNPCTATSCSFANTECVPVFTPPAFPVGPRATRGPTAAISCPCLPGFVQAQAGQPVNFADCMGSCAESNGGCDATTTDCELAGNRLQCRCKPGYTSVSPVTGLPAFGLVVAPGVACTPAPCNYDSPPSCGPGSHCPPAHALVGNCVNVLPGATCNLACESGYAYEHVGDTEVRCVGTHAGSFFSEPRNDHPCVSASRVPKPPTRVSSPFGESWDCTSPTPAGGSTNPVCVPKKPHFTKGFKATSGPFITVAWKAHGSHHLKVVSVDVTISPVTVGTVKSTIDLPDGPGGAGKVTFYGLQPNESYEFELSVTVKNEDGSTTTYLSAPYSVTTCQTASSC